MTKKASTQSGLHIQLLYTSGCEHYSGALRQINLLSKKATLPVEIESICIESLEQAQMYHFLGSPSIRFNGRDIEPLASDIKAFGLT